MADTTLFERLAALPTLDSVPREQLEWLAARGHVLEFEAGAVMVPKGQVLQHLHIFLSGRCSIRVTRAGVTRRVREWKPGEFGGILPYSRMTEAPGNLIADEPVEMFRLHRDSFREMVHECYELTSLCVHEMVDRARLFQSHDLQFEKMASLGRLSAGTAHELNNPAAAIVRTAGELGARRRELQDASRALGAASLGPDALAAVGTLEAALHDTVDHSESPVDRADREDAVQEWLSERGVNPDLAEPLADAALTTAQLEQTAGQVGQPQLETVLRYVAASHLVGALTAEIQIASARIHQLVAALKNYTHRDRALVPEAVRLEENLADTLTILRAEARKKGVTLELHVEPGLPDVLGVRGELNQVWLNLVDNAIDAAPASSHVSVTARRAQQQVAVMVVDNGAGISPEHRERLFEPFFTTKPVGEGTGMGLDAALGIIHRHGGSIEVNSVPGRTEFCVLLPIAQPPSASNVSTS